MIKKNLEEFPARIILLLSLLISFSYSIDCELRSDLVDSCVPGDEVTVCGIVRSRSSLEWEGKGLFPPSSHLLKTSAKGGKKNANTLFQVYLDVNSLDNSKHLESGHRDLMDFSEKVCVVYILVFNDIQDLYSIHFIHDQPNLFSLLVNSICPGIFGHEIVKGVSSSVFV